MIHTTPTARIKTVPTLEAVTRDQVATLCAAP